MYPPVDKVREIAAKRIAEYQLIDEARYDNRFAVCPFKENDVVVLEEVLYPHTKKLAPLFSRPHKILRKCSDVNFEIDKPNYHTKQNSEIVHKTDCDISSRKRRLNFQK